MKYENFEQAEKIVGKIDDLSEMLTKINDDNCRGTLSNHNGFAHLNFYQKDEASPYNKLFLQFHKDVVSSIEKQIQDLKLELETL